MGVRHELTIPSRPRQGARLTALRHLRGLSQSTLASQLGVTQPFLSLVERAERNFPESLALAAAGQYRLPVSFFAVPPELVDNAPVTFRKKASASVVTEARVVQAFREASRLFSHVSKASGYKKADLPDPEHYADDPAACACAVREQLGVNSDAPVPNVTRSLERLGVGVLDELQPPPGGSGEHVSISRPIDATDRPLVAVVGEGLPGAVRRLSLAHELGHLILDRNRSTPIAGTRSQEERRAYAFGAALLVPDQVLRREVSETLTLHGYLRIKANYGISVAALIMRARDLGVITAARARSLQIQSSSQGWRTAEPVEVATERSLLLRQACERSFPGSSPFSIASTLGTDPALVVRWLDSNPDTNGPALDASVTSSTDHRGRRHALVAEVGSL